MGKCKSCNEKKNILPKTEQVNHFLDLATYNLHEAWLYDVPDESRNIISKVIFAIDSLKKPYLQVPCEIRMQRHSESTEILIQYIECQYCKTFEYWDMVVPIQICIYLTGGQYGSAFKLMIERDFKMRYWLLQAIYHKVIKNKLSLWSERLRWYIFKSNHKLNVQNVVN
jgi:hypothetical protein